MRATYEQLLSEIGLAVSNFLLRRHLLITGGSSCLLLLQLEELVDNTTEEESEYTNDFAISNANSVMNSSNLFIFALQITQHDISG